LKAEKYTGDRPHRCQPSTATMLKTTDNIHALIWDYSLNTTNKLCTTTGVGKSAVMAFITQRGYRKVCTTQVLKMLTIKHKTALKERHMCSTLQHSKKDREASLSRIITSDKMWVHNYDPLMKRQLKEWHNQSLTWKQKFKVQTICGYNHCLCLLG
jgi:hypothetical protein